MKRIILVVLIFALIIMSGCSNSSTDNNEIQNEYTIKSEDKKYTYITKENLVDLYEDEKLIENRITQLLYLEPVIVLEEKEESILVETKDKIRGYLRKNTLSDNLEVLSSDDFQTKICITSPKKTIYLDMKGKVPYKEVYMGSVFYLRKLHNDWIEVLLDNNEKGYMTISNTIMYTEDIPIRTNKENFVRNIKRFSNVRFVKGGISEIIGADMKNSIYISAYVNGVDLGRDLSNIDKFYIETNEYEIGDIFLLAENRHEEKYSQIAVYTKEGFVIMKDEEKNIIAELNIMDKDIRNRIRKVARIFK